jgi:hypothetical protein
LRATKVLEKRKRSRKKWRKGRERERGRNNRNAVNTKSDGNAVTECFISERGCSMLKNGLYAKNLYVIPLWNVFDNNF